MTEGNIFIDILTAGIRAAMTDSLHHVFNHLIGIIDFIRKSYKTTHKKVLLNREKRKFFLFLIIL